MNAPKKFLVHMSVLLSYFVALYLRRIKNVIETKLLLNANGI